MTWEQRAKAGVDAKHFGGERWVLNLSATLRPSVAQRLGAFNCLRDVNRILQRDLARADPHKDRKEVFSDVCVGSVVQLDYAVPR